MRPIEKGKSKKTYKIYQDARNDLCEVIGWYCSYCEMHLRNMPEVEHVIPVAHNGPPLDWDNFLISCKYCNVVKKDNNTGRINYYWPDTDNTFRGFSYQKGIPIQASTSLKVSESIIADNTIKLCGLNREPGSETPPTDKDTRWGSRLQAWDVALASLNNWTAEPTPNMASQIALCAMGHGHFSIWMEIFKDYKVVIEELIKVFPGTAKNCFDQNMNPVKRIGGNL
ncbi:HNH endonuclease [Halalkalibacter flavus]|uniref:HNH endonuclease n=1 Tax=Halalkalibacter flavus TaxID=3090668 RepID=UPI002FC5F34F